MPEVNCRDTPGCAHFTFLHHDGTCKVFGLDALWLSQPGAVSGPARCVAQVRMMLEDLDLAKLETQKDLVEGRFMYGATHSVDFEGCLTLCCLAT